MARDDQAGVDDRDRPARLRSEESTASAASASSGSSGIPAPPLPPRPPAPATSESHQRHLPVPLATAASSKPTTAVSATRIQTVTFPDGSRGNFSRSATRIGSAAASGYTTPGGGLPGGVNASPGYGDDEDDHGGPSNDNDDVMSVASAVPPSTLAGAGTIRGAAPADLASLLAEGLGRKSAAWLSLRAQSAGVRPFESAMGGDSAGGRGKFGTVLEEGDETHEDGGLGSGKDGRLDAVDMERVDGKRLAEHPIPGQQFEEEFDDLPGGVDDEERLRRWKSKLKHYMILSSAGKPIYSRHGDLSLINASMGVVQTIISFYENESSSGGGAGKLLGFTAGDARFVVASEGPLYLVAISRLGESDGQLRAQLDALYMQILSTLTLPTLTSIFANRPSTDLRKPLQGTEGLLSSLADNFTRGSPSMLLGALECLRLRKSHRQTINNAFLKVRSEKLLYGLIVAGGKLVSVIRPRRHSLHPSDLQLIFNMLFESGGIKSGGGENWIPLCLPAFNNRGYLYMYVSFFDEATDAAPPADAKDKNNVAADGPEADAKTTSAASAEDEIAIVLISTDKESFFSLQQMREKLVRQLTRNGSLSLIRAAVSAGRPRVQDAAIGGRDTAVSHFLYKSRPNVQFVMSALDPLFTGLLARRRLMTLYHQVHAAAHARNTHLRVLHCVGDEASSLAWITPVFELYCVAGPNASRAVLTQGANRIVQWAKREEERLFIIGGATF